MIQVAKPEDAEALSALVNSAYRGDSSRQGWTTEADLLDGTRIDGEAMLEILNRPYSVILKYESQGEIQGCVELDHQGNKLYLGMLTVKPGLQGKGIGKQLLQAADLEATRQECDAIFMTVITVRHELIAWYKRNGFHDTGQRKPFAMPDERFGIPKSKLEFMVMEKRLS